MLKKYIILLIFLIRTIDLSATDFKNLIIVKTTGANKIERFTSNADLYFDLKKYKSAEFEFRFVKNISLYNKHYIDISIFVPTEIYDNTLMFFITIKLFDNKGNTIVHKKISLNEGLNNVKINLLSHKWKSKDSDNYTYILKRDFLKNISKYRIILSSSHSVVGKVNLKDVKFYGLLTKSDIREINKKIEQSIWNVKRIVNMIFPKSSGVYGIFSEPEDIDNINNSDSENHQSIIKPQDKFDIEKSTDAEKIIKKGDVYELYFDLKNGGFLHAGFNLLFNKIRDFSNYKNIIVEIVLSKDISANELDCRIVLNNSKWEAVSSKFFKLEKNDNIITFNIKDSNWSTDWGKTYGEIPNGFLNNIKRVVIDIHSNNKIKSKVILKKIYLKR